VLLEVPLELVVVPVDEELVSQQVVQQHRFNGVVLAMNRGAQRVVESDTGEERHRAGCPQRAEVGEFLQELDDHDDVQRIWAALK